MPVGPMGTGPMPSDVIGEIERRGDDKLSSRLQCAQCVRGASAHRLTAPGLRHSWLPV